VSTYRALHRTVRLSAVRDRHSRPVHAASVMRHICVCLTTLSVEDGWRLMSEKGGGHTKDHKILCPFPCWRLNPGPSTVPQGTFRTSNSTLGNR
jgi:hypothetical protein